MWALEKDSHLYYQYENNRDAENAEFDLKIPGLIEKSSDLSKLKNKWPLSEAIDNILDLKQKEWDNENIKKGYESINKMANWDLRFDWEKFEWKIWYSNTAWKKLYAIVKEWDVVPDSIWIEFSLNDVIVEMNNILKKRMPKVKNFLANNPVLTRSWVNIENHYISAIWDVITNWLNSWEVDNWVLKNIEYDAKFNQIILEMDNNQYLVFWVKLIWDLIVKAEKLKAGIHSRLPLLSSSL